MRAAAAFSSGKIRTITDSATGDDEQETRKPKRVLKKAPPVAGGGGQVVDFHVG